MTDTRKYTIRAQSARNTLLEDLDTGVTFILPTNCLSAYRPLIVHPSEVFNADSCQELY
jgi:hypothetical protein